MILPTKNTGLTHQAEDTHGGYFKNAAGVTLAFSHLGGAPVIDCETFFRFYAQAKKYHTLSVNRPKHGIVNSRPRKGLVIRKKMGMYPLN
jgi:hypothetical protein